MVSQNFISSGMLLACICISAYAIYYLVTPKTVGQQLRWDGLNPLKREDFCTDNLDLIFKLKNGNSGFFEINSWESFKYKCAILFKVSLSEDKERTSYNLARDWCTKEFISAKK